MDRNRGKKRVEPKQERAEIGTPAGESAEEGRRRHGTECLTPECGGDNELRSRHTIEDDVSEEDFTEDGEEIATTGGLTGTHVKGGIPAGGTQAGGTPNTRRRQVPDDGSEG